VYCTHPVCNNDYKTEKFSVELVDDSPFHLRGSFPGPQDSPYEGGNFEVVSSTVISSVHAKAFHTAWSPHRRTSSSQTTIPLHRPNLSSSPRSTTQTSPPPVQSILTSSTVDGPPRSPCLSYSSTSSPRSVILSSVILSQVILSQMTPWMPRSRSYLYTRARPSRILHGTGLAGMLGDLPTPRASACEQPARLQIPVFILHMFD
jgi:hypothetical protein